MLPHHLQSLTLLRDCFPSLKTLRITPNPRDGSYIPYIPFAAETLVLFPSNALEPDPNDPYVDNAAHMPPPPPGVSCAFPYSCTKVVINMKSDYTPCVYLFEGIDCLPFSVKDITVIGPFYSSHGSRKYRFMDPMHFLETEKLIGANPDAAFTIVSTDTEHGCYPEDVCSRIVADIRNQSYPCGATYHDDIITQHVLTKTAPIHDPIKNSKTWKALRNVTFRTRNEYEGLVGEERFRIEAVQYL